MTDQNPPVISTPDELLAALRKAEEFVESELGVRQSSYGPNPENEDEAADVADAEDTLKLLRAAIAKVGGGCE